jgi:hypothetical protein
MANGTFMESKMSMAARVVTTGALAVLGLLALKFIIGLFGAIVAITMFVLLKVVPIVLIGLVVVWLFRKLTRDKNSVTTTA